MRPTIVSDSRGENSRGHPVRRDRAQPAPGGPGRCCRHRFAHEGLDPGAVPGLLRRAPDGVERHSRRARRSDADRRRDVFRARSGRRLVACGGWSRRDKLFSGEASQEGRSRLLDPATEPARIRAMFVRGDWTRRGLGTRILRACEAAAAAEGFRTLELLATYPGTQLTGTTGSRPGRRRRSRSPTVCRWGA